ncbi:helix-turn-helix transcriptional regulator [Pedococcus sp. 5OH_020]|uniref:helix-turn-helix transcriptional regulator n=1 Tax=Pedococcus sp. 5OH_020 TaxID=2989814 RepID=UPI0022E9DFF6|nr:WYL domain-containing protein [Pedococcus sp. 5OH_020]
MTTPETATARLSRLLTMVPWLVNRQGIDLERAAADLGITVQQLETDLRLLYLCGYGQMPDELIDAEWENGRVFISNAETIARPLRLGRDEALTLMVGLRALAAVPGLGERDAIERAMAKLEEATGASAEAAARVQVSIDEGVEADLLADARRAVEEHRRVHLRYLVPSRDESTERDVDPMRVVNLDAHWYLEGWCHRAQDTRLFRMDRIEGLALLDVDGTPPPDAQLRDLDAGTFTPREEDTLVTLELQPGASWVSDYYPVESVLTREDGTQVVALRTADTLWLRRLMWRLGGYGRVLAPAELAQAVSEGARSALAAYESQEAAAGAER